MRADGREREKVVGWRGYNRQGGRESAEWLGGRDKDGGVGRKYTVEKEGRIRGREGDRGGRGRHREEQEGGFRRRDGGRGKQREQ